MNKFAGDFPNLERNLPDFGKIEHGSRQSARNCDADEVLIRERESSIGGAALERASTKNNETGIGNCCDHGVKENK